MFLMQHQICINPINLLGERLYQGSKGKVKYSVYNYYKIHTSVIAQEALFKNKDEKIMQKL